MFNPLLILNLSFIGLCLGYHIWIVVNGVAENPPDDPPIDEGGQSIAENLEVEHPTNITKTFYVSDSPEHIEEFEELVKKWAKKRLKHGD